MRSVAVHKHLAATWLLCLAFGVHAQTTRPNVGTMPSMRDCTLSYRVHPPQVANADRS